MSNADAQVINMVNAPHEARARQAKARKDAKRRRTRAQQEILLLVVKLELYAIAIALLFIAAAQGWVTWWIGGIGIAVCIAAGAVEIGRHMER